MHVFLTVLGSRQPQFSLWSPFHPVSFANFWFWSMHSNYNWYHRHPHVPQIFQISCKVYIFLWFFTFFYLYSKVRWKGGKNTGWQVLCFSWINSCFFFFFLFSFGLGDLLYFSILENHMHLIFKEGYWFDHMSFVSMIKF